MALIKLKNINKTYSHSKVAFHCDLLIVDKSDKIGIAGETGSGKSTLLKIIAGLEKPEGGEALYNNNPIYPKLDRLIPGHPEMAYLSQSFELPKSISVWEFLDAQTNSERDIEIIARLCEITGLLHNATRSLSGGERQRVALARVLLHKPSVLLLDEPYSNLDPHHKRTMKKVVKNIGEKTRTTIIMVSHDPADLLPWADSILLMRDGAIIRRGTPKEIYNLPKDKYEAGLFGGFVELNAKSWNVGKGDVIVRPERFCIGKEGKEGVIESIEYHGSYEILKICIDYEIVLAKTNPNIYHVGEYVKLKLSSYDLGKGR